MPKYFFSRLVCLCLVLAAVLPIVGCNEEKKRTAAMVASSLLAGIAQTQHAQKAYQRPNWKAEEYFDDPKVIRLCNAIGKRDLALIDKLIAEGTDVNAKGNGNMTPLLWAFVQGRPWNKPPSRSQQIQPGFSEKWATAEFDAVHLAIFTKLLEHGADPNVRFTANFFGDHPYADLPYKPITRIVAYLAFPYFEIVMKNGGDPHLYFSIREQPAYEDSVVRYAGKTDSLKKLQWVIGAGVDIDQVDAKGQTPVMHALDSGNYNGGNYDVAIMLVEAGADWLVARPDNPDFLAPIVNTIVKRDVQTPSSMKLIDVLERKGADFDIEREIIRTPRGKDREVLQQQRRELYERIQQERIQQAEK